MRLFDLNIETVLEHWDCEHGLRELIANALDECVLTGTSPISISKDDDERWHVRDYGRGIRIEHFTLNENAEKIGADGVIGKFGVGLKDALAVLDRHRAKVTIQSRHGKFNLTKASKHDFDGITTLHVSHAPGDPAMCGTDIALAGVPDSAMERAKSMFLCFREHQILDSTPFGQILAAPPSGAEVFINGVWVNTEAGFLFSYNVTSLTQPMRKALNRERVNIGRGVYADRLRQILRASEASEVLKPLAVAYANRDRGELAEELTWLDVAHKALNELAKTQKVVAVSHTEMKTRPDLVEDIKRDGHEIVILTDREKQRADEQTQKGKAPFHTLTTWIQSVNDSFQYRFVDADELSEAETSLWQHRHQILALVGAKSETIPRLLISETMRESDDGTHGAWDSSLGAIIVKRTQLRSLSALAGTLLHEFGHASTGAVDSTRAFENVLTHFLGTVAVRALNSSPSPSATPDVEAHPETVPCPPEPPLVLDGFEFIPVESSNIEGVAYDQEQHTLYVVFRNGSRYYYRSVPETVFSDLMNAPSKGRYLNAAIVGRYSYGHM